MDEMKLHNLPAGFRMTPGMPVTADIKVGKANRAGVSAIAGSAHVDGGHAGAVMAWLCSTLQDVAGRVKTLPAT